MRHQLLRVALLVLLAARPAYGQHSHTPHNHAPRMPTPAGDAFDPSVISRSEPSTLGVQLPNVDFGDTLVFLPAGTADCTGAVAASEAAASDTVTVDQRITVTLHALGRHKACWTHLASPATDAQFEVLDGAHLTVEEGKSTAAFLEELEGETLREAGGGRDLLPTMQKNPDLQKVTRRESGGGRELNQDTITGIMHACKAAGVALADADIRWRPEADGVHFMCSRKSRGASGPPPRTIVPGGSPGGLRDGGVADVA